MMTRDEVDDVVCDVMRHEGPDRHVDGHDYLTDFVMAVQAGEGEAWLATRQAERARERANREAFDNYLMLGIPYNAPK